MERYYPSGIGSIAPEVAPLPITSADDLSHFHQTGTIEAHGGDAKVTVWLEGKAATPEWRAHIELSRQLNLFD